MGREVGLDVFEGAVPVWCIEHYFGVRVQPIRSRATEEDGGERHACVCLAWLFPSLNMAADCETRDLGRCTQIQVILCVACSKICLITRQRR